MKMLGAIPLLAMLYPQPSNPPQEQYPVHFHMVYVHSSMRQNSHHGQGIANISEAGQPTRGFQFSFDACADFHHDFHDLPARWSGKDHYQLIVQLADAGPGTKEECILNGRVQNFKYEKVDGKPSEVPLGPPVP
jgi:hypothetical protein